MKARKNFESGKSTSFLKDDPTFKQLQHNVVVAVEDRNKSTGISKGTRAGSAAFGTGKNIPDFKAKRELKQYVEKKKKEIRDSRKS